MLKQLHFPNSLSHLLLWGEQDLLCDSDVAACRLSCTHPLSLRSNCFCLFFAAPTVWPPGPPALSLRFPVRLFLFATVSASICVASALLW